MDMASLSVEQRAEWDRIVGRVMAKARVEIETAALLVVSKADPQLFGQTEFQLRDMMHRLGASVLDAALDERKKRGTKGRRQPARTATKQPASSDTATRK
jgi:hypothetical protein